MSSSNMAVTNRSYEAVLIPFLMRNKEEFACCLAAHSQKQPSVAESADIGCSVAPLSVPYRKIDNLQIQFRSSEQEIKISEWVEVAKVTTVFGDTFIVHAQQHFRPAKRILDVLAQEMAK